MHTQYCAVFIQKKFTCKWNHAVQTRVVQGLAVYVLGHPHNLFSSLNHLSLICRHQALSLDLSVSFQGTGSLAQRV